MSGWSVSGKGGRRTALAAFIVLLGLAAWGLFAARDRGPRSTTPGRVRVTSSSGAPSVCGRAWTRIAAARIPGDDEELVSGIAVLSRRNAWAVGTRFLSGHPFGVTLAEEWDGRSWQIVPTPGPFPGKVGDSAGLASVVAAGPSDVWAVGTHWKGRGSRPLIEHWDGARWRIVPGARVAVGGLEGLALISSHDIWGVGWSGSESLIEHWNGTHWTAVPSPSRGTSTVLVGVAAVDGRHGWAVGSWMQGVGETVQSHAFALRLDGTRWRRVPAPAAMADAQLGSVSMPSAGEAWVASQAASRHVAEWRNGRWELRPTFMRVANVNAQTTGDVWATGSSDSWSSALLQWSGDSWHQVLGLDLGPLDALTGFAVGSDGSRWVSGTHGRHQGSDHPFFERSCP